MTKRKLLSMMAVTLFVAIMAFSGSANADGLGVGEVGFTEIPGSTLVFSYYDIRTNAQGGPGLSDNYFTISNLENYDVLTKAATFVPFPPLPRDEVGGWVQAHVRVRTGQCSVELLDFDVLLSPGDVFTFDLYQTATGSTQFASCDTDTLVASGFNVDSNGCYVLDSTTFPDMLGLIETCGNCPDGSGAPLSAADALEATRWGYVEVIGEVDLIPAEFGSMAGCSDATECTSDQLKAGDYTAWSFVDDVKNTSGDDCSNCAWYQPVYPVLFGKVYYAKFDAERNLVQLSTLNAHAIPDAAGYEEMIIHRPCYQDTSPGCSSGDGELDNTNDFVADDARYAYAAASIDTTPAGAKDMNYCFYKDKIDGSTVTNRVGAAATFGPTFVDLCHRTGDPDYIVSCVYDISDMFGKAFAGSHYFYLPGQGQTRYVFTFPLQHFINQKIEITKFARFNNDEEACSIPTGKFISPGLPVPGLPRGEVTILNTQEPNDTCTYNEGWLAFALQVTDDGPGAGDPDSIFPYYPYALGVVVNWGDGSTANVHSTAPMTWIPIELLEMIFGAD
jgi:hypothetical protein